jgi:hypothetical protein
MPMQLPKHPAKFQRVTRDTLTSMVVFISSVAAEWQLLQRRCLSFTHLTPQLRTAVVLLAQRAEANCGRLVDRAVAGLASLDEGDTRASARALEACLAMFVFNQTADRLATRLLGGSKPNTRHGNH